MTKNRWQLQEAKSRFSELVENALKQGAQTVTKHGRPAVVVISVEEYERSRAPRKSLVDVLRACPEDLTDLVGRRPKRMARKVDFG